MNAVLAAFFSAMAARTVSSATSVALEKKLERDIFNDRGSMQPKLHASPLQPAALSLRLPRWVWKSGPATRTSTIPNATEGAFAANSAAWALSSPQRTSRIQCNRRCILGRLGCLGSLITTKIRQVHQSQPRHLSLFTDVLPEPLLVRRLLRTCSS